MYQTWIKVYNIPGEKTDAVIFVVDSQIRFFEDNIEFILELKSIANDRLIKGIQFIIMLNKQDLKGIII